jgi:hypothetical protein
MAWVFPRGYPQGPLLAWPPSGRLRRNSPAPLLSSGWQRTMLGRPCAPGQQPLLEPPASATGTRAPCRSFATAPHQPCGTVTVPNRARCPAGPPRPRRAPCVVPPCSCRDGATNAPTAQVGGNNPPALGNNRLATAQNHYDALSCNDMTSNINAKCTLITCCGIVVRGS